ncbi:MAG: hypothetical protein PF513_02175 [Tenericutes bacterium]|jgi:quercetin dioxygenase-like cupin family protein|nr:hypothetical protein [Mycoplasmatota bacterium]
MYITIIRGILSIGLNDNDVHQYTKGIVLKIPYDTTMNVKNNNNETLELIIVKSPIPRKSCI